MVFILSNLIIVLPYAFAFLCNDITGCPVPSVLQPSTLTLEKLKKETGWPKDGIYGLASLEVTGWVVAYYLLNLALYTALPAEEFLGTELRSGGKLKYRFNGAPTLSIPKVHY